MKENQTLLYATPFLVIAKPVRRLVVAIRILQCFALRGSVSRKITDSHVGQSPPRNDVVKSTMTAIRRNIIMAISVLIVEDDRNIQELLQLYLEKEGYAVTVASDGGQGLAKFRSIKPDLVLLDVMMPVMDGWAVCKAIRADSQTPIIMLTAKGETNDKVSGLKSGADDYVTKPFEMKELLARIEAVLRRTGTAPVQESARRLSFDKMTIDMDAFELIINGKKVDTPPKEMELLFYLASSPNRVYTRNQLLDEVWGFDYFGDSRTVDVHVKRLREKLEGVSEQWNLKTVWGVGYKFEVL